jgi:hypothetical protein
MRLAGHDGYVNAVCTMPAGGHTLLACDGNDRRARLRDPQTGTRTATVPAHHAPHAVTTVADSLAIGLDAGVLVISLDPSLSHQHSRATPDLTEPAQATRTQRPAGDLSRMKPEWP